MDIAVTGASGLIGTALSQALSAGGHTPIPVVRPGSRRPSGVACIAWDPSTGTIDSEAFEGLDAVVHLAGEGIGDRRWTAQQKRRILDSRTQGTSLLAAALAGLRNPPPVLLSGSAIGYYGDTGETPTDEHGTTGDDFPARVCIAWEAATRPAEDAGIRVGHLRTGIVLSARGGALARQLPLFRWGLGGRAGSGRQWQSWISIDDEVGAIVHLLTAEVSGPVNLTAPNTVTNGELTKTLGSVLHRPTTVLPMLGPRLLFGREMADSLLLTSQRVMPAVLMASGYRFEHPELRGALEHLLE
jgi:uncharacterized protein (TIGR01777 family)